MTSRRVARRALSWASKKSIASEGNARRFPLLRRGHLEQLRGTETERARDHRVRKTLARRVVVHDGVVVCLAREGDLVLSRGQLFHELSHRLIRLQVRIRLGEREQFADGARQPC